MAEIFEVSTDYLLKDEMGKEEVEKISDYRTEDTVYRNVSMEEANHFLEWKRKNAVILAGGSCSLHHESVTAHFSDRSFQCNGWKSE